MAACGLVWASLADCGWHGPLGLARLARAGNGRLPHSGVILYAQRIHSAPLLKYPRLNLKYVQYY